jgi:replicative DNA helicase
VKKTSPSQTEHSLRLPPHSLEAEQCLIGGLMLDSQNFDSIAAQLGASDFYHPDHRLIFTAMAQLHRDNKPVDILTVSEILTRDNMLEQTGGLAFLAELAQQTPGTSNLLFYCNIVRERSIRRQLIHAAKDIAEIAYEPGDLDESGMLTHAEQQLIRLSESRPATGGFIAINPLLKGTMEHIDTMSKLTSTVTGLSTGYYKLDELTSGLQKSDLIIIAARPSMGKTTLAMNIAENVIIKQDKPVVVFSMEMPAQSLMLRMVASVGRINQTHVRTGKLEYEEFDKLNTSFLKLKDRPLFIDDTPALSPIDMRSRLRRLAREQGEPALIIVDYLQLMQMPGNKENRNTEVSEISLRLKQIAREFNCPLVALSQLNRGVDSRTDKRPNNSDLRDSGAIEQDADLIMFIYREEVYDKETENKGNAEVIISKQRNGPIDKVNLVFNGHFTRFDNAVAPGYEQR